MTRVVSSCLTSFLLLSCDISPVLSESTGRVSLHCNNVTTTRHSRILTSQFRKEWSSKASYKLTGTWRGGISALYCLTGSEPKAISEDKGLCMLGEIKMAHIPKWRLRSHCDPGRPQESPREVFAGFAHCFQPFVLNTFETPSHTIHCIALCVLRFSLVI